VALAVTEWDRTADWWQQQFTAGADPEYTEQIIPMARQELSGARRVLDVGCGEGQITRAVDAPVRVGIDPTWPQLEQAVRRGAGPAYARGAAATLPFPEAVFDAVVACLVFEHIPDAATAIGEVARVLEAGGTFLFFLNHPLLQTPGSGWIDDHILDEQYWRVGPYLTEDTTVEQVDNGVFLPFVHRPLSHYVNAMAAVGLFITRMEEPAPPRGFLARAEEYMAAATIPRLLMLKATRE
jgi:ubiquinone/menaquinone biosynthesis C-methylase UbiE